MAEAPAIEKTEAGVPIVKKVAPEIAGLARETLERTIGRNAHSYRRHLARAYRFFVGGKNGNGTGRGVMPFVQVDVMGKPVVKVKLGAEECSLDFEDACDLATDVLFCTRELLAAQAAFSRRQRRDNQTQEN